METAKQKALEVASRMHQKDLRAPDIVIGADTIVVLKGSILEKPVDKADAYSMLSRLNGKEHCVFTGVAIVRCSSQGGKLHMDVSEFYEETRVQFSQLSEELLWDYIHSGEPMDKAGGYGIQALGGMLVEAIHGDFFNVVGFPLNQFCKKLSELYGPPRPEDLQWVQGHSTPTMHTFNTLGNVPGGGCSQGGAWWGHNCPQAQGRKDAKDSEHKPTVENMSPAAIIKIIDGFKICKVLLTACKIKLFDLLRDKGPLSVADVARNLDISEEGSGHLLDILVAFQLLNKTERGYSNTHLASLYLASDVEHSLHSFVVLHEDVIWPFFSHLEFAIREGVVQSRRILGVEVKDIYQELLYRTQEQKLQFIRAMRDHVKVDAPMVATAFDLSRFTSACDLGGSIGILAYELARQHPGLRVTVFDRPEVIEEVVHFQPDGPQTGQVSFMSGDFFNDTLPEADLYILSKILHTWPDDQAHRLLSRISSSCKPGGGVLVVELLLNEDKRKAQYAVLYSLCMMVLFRAKERTLNEYRSLLRTHGFTNVRGVCFGNLVDAVLATKA
ncbi:putative bifunctional dTTP/UTP pyrophosphatase/methyltransferase protein isoform 2-T2 [Glossophaga mutica]